MEPFVLLILLLAVAIVAAYFYLKRRQQHVHVDAAGQGVEHRHQKSPTEPVADHGHDLDRPGTARED